jgi:hypothetical protein
MELKLNLRIRNFFNFPPFLIEVLKNEKTRTWIGGKFGGIYIGF